MVSVFVVVLTHVLTVFVATQKLLDWSGTGEERRLSPGVTGGGLPRGSADVSGAAAAGAAEGIGVEPSPPEPGTLEEEALQRSRRRAAEAGNDRCSIKCCSDCFLFLCFRFRKASAQHLHSCYLGLNDKGYLDGKVRQILQMVVRN